MMTPKTRFVNSSTPPLLLYHPVRLLNSTFIPPARPSNQNSTIPRHSDCSLLRLYIVKNHTHVFLNIPMGNAVQMRTSQGYY